MIVAETFFITNFALNQKTLYFCLLIAKKGNF